jgi:hypothetical protein
VIQSTGLTLVKHESTWAITSKTSPTNPNYTFWSTIVHLGQNPTEKPLTPCWPIHVSRNFCHVLQIFPKHLKFSQYKSCVFCRGTQLSCWAALLVWSAKGEKWKSTHVGTLHWSRGFLQLGIKFVHKWLRKRTYALCKSCRGLIGLQLLYLSLGSLQFKNLEKNGFKQR